MCKHENDQNDHQNAVILVAVTDQLSDKRALITPEDFKILSASKSNAILAIPEHITDTPFLFDKSDINQSAAQILKIKLLNSAEAMNEERNSNDVNQNNLISNFQDNYIFHKDNDQQGELSTIQV